MDLALVAPLDLVEDTVLGGMVREVSAFMKARVADSRGRAALRGDFELDEFDRCLRDGAARGWNEVAKGVAADTARVARVFEPVRESRQL